MNFACWLALGAAFPGCAGAADATVVNWADLTSYDGATGEVDGSIAVGADNVGVAVQGSGYAFVNLGNPGETNFWTEGNPRPYTGGDVSNAPPTTDLIALNQGGLKTITFSQAVTDPYLALVSWNGNSGTFNQTFDVVSQGCGYWGCGTFANVTPFSFDGNGELHGIIRFQGTFTSVSFTDLSENWHGIQIGVAGVAPTVPEPASWATMVLGFGAIGFATRRRRASMRFA